MSKEFLLISYLISHYAQFSKNCAHCAKFFASHKQQQRNATHRRTYKQTRTCAHIHIHTCMRQCSVAHYNAEWESGSERERERQHISLARSGCSPSGSSSEHLRCEWCVSRAYACVCVCECGHNHACVLCCSCARTFVKENGLHTLTACRTLRTQCGRCVFTDERRTHFLSTNWDFVAHGWKPFSKQKQQQKSAHRISSPNNTN